MLFVFPTVTKESEVLVFPQMLEQTKGKLLTVVFYAAVSFIE